MIKSCVFRHFHASPKTFSTLWQKCDQFEEIWQNGFITSLPARRWIFDFSVHSTTKMCPKFNGFWCTATIMCDNAINQWVNEIWGSLISEYGETSHRQNAEVWPKRFPKNYKTLLMPRVTELCKQNDCISYVYPPSIVSFTPCFQTIFILF